MEFSDDELGALDDVLVDELDRYIDEPDRKMGGYAELTEVLFQKVRDEAKRRKLWWAR